MYHPTTRSLTVTIAITHSLNKDALLVGGTSHTWYCLPDLLRRWSVGVDVGVHLNFFNHSACGMLGIILVLPLASTTKRLGVALGVACAAGLASHISNRMRRWPRMSFMAR